MSRDVSDVAHHHDRLIDAGGLGRRRQLQFQFAKACFCAHEWISVGGLSVVAEGLPVGC